jgi:hypothetical protein
MRQLCRSAILLVLLSGAAYPTWAQVSFLESPSLTSPGSVSSLPPSNSVSHIATDSQTVWIGTGKGLARTPNGGRSWESFRNVPQFAKPGIFSIALRGDTVWTSTGFTKEVNDQNVQTGAGYTFSTDDGSTWVQRPQTLDARDDSIVIYGVNRIRFLPIVVPEQNVTFDVALSSGTVWIASWSSGIRKSTDLGQTWQRVVLPSFNRNSISPADSLTNYVVDPRNDNNFLGFAVFAQSDSIIWAGTAGGINRSTDGGASWTKFTTTNQQAHILGNWVIAIEGQQVDTTYRVWCTNWPTNQDERYGVSFSDDGGRIWQNLLHGIKAYDFAFKDSITYIATDDGVFRTADGGETWIRSGTIVDKNSGQQITSRGFFSVGVLGDTVFCGGGDGIAKTIDNASHPFGQSWEILRTYKPVGNTSTTYAYPNPFSPKDVPTRIHYSTAGAAATVTVEVFDFGMNRVRTIIHNAPRTGSAENEEIWDGTTDNRERVANGVYFYRVVINDGEPRWGKIMVLQ